MRTLGVLLAGGAGARLGLGVAKALVRVGEQTLLERALATLARTCDAVVVSAPADLALPVPTGVARVDDPPGARGPLAGMVAGLAAVPFERAFVLGVDFPFAGPATVAALLACLDEARAAETGGACGAGPVEAVQPAPAGIAQPLVAAYAPAARELLAARLAAGARAPSLATASLARILLDDAALARMPGGADAFFNLNTPDDLAEARRRIARGASPPSGTPESPMTGTRP